MRVEESESCYSWDSLVSPHWVHFRSFSLLFWFGKRCCCLWTEGMFATTSMVQLETENSFRPLTRSDVKDWKQESERPVTRYVFVFFKSTKTSRWFGESKAGKANEIPAVVEEMQSFPWILWNSISRISFISIEISCLLHHHPLLSSTPLSWSCLPRDPLSVFIELLMPSWLRSGSSEENTVCSSVSRMNCHSEKSRKMSVVQKRS